MFVHACYLLWIYKYQHYFIKQSHNMHGLNLAKEQTQGEQPTWQKRTTIMFNKYRLWRKMGWGGPPNADPYTYIYIIIFRCCATFLLCFWIVYSQNREPCQVPVEIGRKPKPRILHVEKDWVSNVKYVNGEFKKIYVCMYIYIHDCRRKFK